MSMLINRRTTLALGAAAAASAMFAPTSQEPRSHSSSRRCPYGDDALAPQIPPKPLAFTMASTTRPISPS